MSERNERRKNKKQFEWIERVDNNKNKTTAKKNFARRGIEWARTWHTINMFGQFRIQLMRIKYFFFSVFHSLLLHILFFVSTLCSQTCGTQIAWLNACIFSLSIFALILFYFYV